LVIIAFDRVSDINIILVRFLRRFERLRSRIVPQVLIISLITVVLVYFWKLIAARVFAESEIITHQVTQFTMLLGFFFLALMHHLILMSNMTNEWMAIRKEVERLKNAKLQSDYNSLQDRLNPHFLFNNLSVLKSLIRYSPDDAEKFTQNFTDVYRYLLKSHENRTVSVANELQFLEAYIALHKERLGEGLKVSIDVKENALQHTLPPMSIQLLVENAIKHNVVSRSKPLYIYISSDADVLTVKNKIRKKETTYSTHTGLKTLQAQYELISNRHLEIKEEGGDYIVSVPLL
jgi:two-component system LytT family sensor kinase